jgi:hypothetical protein
MALTLIFADLNIYTEYDISIWKILNDIYAFYK